MAQARERFGEQLYNQYMGGATTVGQQAVGITQMENAIAEAEGMVIQGELICCVNSLL